MLLIETCYYTIRLNVSEFATATFQWGVTISKTTVVSIKAKVLLFCWYTSEVICDETRFFQNAGLWKGLAIARPWEKGMYQRIYHHVHSLTLRCLINRHALLFISENIFSLQTIFQVTDERQTYLPAFFYITHEKFYKMCPFIRALPFIRHLSRSA